MIDRILVTLDGTKGAERVLPYVRDLSPRFGSEVDLLAVGVGNKRRKVNQLLEKYINTASAALVKDGVKASPVISYGHPAEEILAYIRENDFDLIIIATHGRSGIARWWMGSVAERVITETEAPVLVIRGRRPSKDEAQKKMTFHNILVPLDGSDIGEAALKNIEALAKKNGALVNLLQVVPPAGGVDFNLFGNEDSQLIKAMADSARDYLLNISSRLESQGVKTTWHILPGRPASVIVDQASSLKADMIAMSSHGRSGIARWVMGSVADKVLHASNLPIWLVRPPKMAFKDSKK